MADQISTGFVSYSGGDIECEGYLAHAPSQTTGRPCVIVAHAWDGQNQNVRDRTDQIAAQGYVAFALDAYGKGFRGDEAADNSHLMRPLMADRALLRRRLEGAVSAARRQPGVDPDRVAVVGYCFGGLCALDIARSPNTNVKGIASFHGAYSPPKIGPQAPISAKVLLLHGWEDPVTPQDQTLALLQELSEAQADWQLHAYGRTMHSFTSPNANLPERGLLYNAAADRRSWAAMLGFLEETIGRPS
jgi:dienelactone hydrolase